MEKIKFFLIHNKDPKRREVVLKQLTSNGVDINDIEFVEYPNKNELTYQIKKSAVQRKRHRHNQAFPDIKGSIKDGWICVSYKHYLALERIVESKYPLAVIIEDNVGYINSDVMKTLNRCLKELPNNWDIVFDSTHAHSFPMMGEGQVTKDKIVYKKNLGYSYNKEGKIIAGGGTKSAQFYMVNLDSAQKLYENYLPFNHAPDAWMNELFRYLNFNSYWIEPSITKTRENHTSSTNFDKRFSVYKIKSKIQNIILGI